MHRFLVFFLLSVPALAQTADERREVQQAANEAGMNDAAIAKMTGDQIHDVLRHQHEVNHEPPAVAMVAVVGFFSASILTVFAVLFAVYRVYQQRALTLRLMVEKGVQIPPELIAPKPRPDSDLRRGLVLCGLGLGLGIFLFAVAEHGMWTLGLVPLLVGAGYLVAARVTRSTEAVAS